MAKLPEIQYRQRSALPRGGNIGAAVAASAANFKLADDAMAAAGAITEAHRQYELDTINSTYQDEMSQWRMKAATMKYATPADIIAMELDDVIETEGRTVIPKSEWYPLALERKMTQTRNKYGDRIVSPVDRQTWMGETQAADRKTLEVETLSAIEQSYKHYEDLKRVDIAEAKAGANFQTAREKAVLLADDVERANTIRDINVAEEEYVEALYITNATPDELREQAREYRTKDYINGSARSAEQLTDAATRLERIADEKEDEVKLTLTQQKDTYQSNWLRTLHNAAESGTLTYESILMAENSDLADESFIKTTRALWKNYKDNQAAGPWAKTNDPKVLSQVRSKINNPEYSRASAARELEAAIPFLTEAKWNELDKALQDSTNPANVVGARNVQQQIDGHLLAMGIDTSSKADADEVRMAESYRSIVDAALTDAQVAKGDKPLTATERTTIVNTSMYRQERTVPGRLWGENTYGSAVEAIEEYEGENSTAVVKDIIARIQAKGGRVTPDMIMRFYRIDKGWNVDG